MSFPLGRIVATPGALQALEQAGEEAINFLRRHQSQDWGNVPEEDAESNTAAVNVGLRIISSYCTKLGAKIWIITEADRSSTCVLLPEEY